MAIQIVEIKPKDVTSVYAGTVIQAGTGENIARQISIGSGIPTTVPCMTLNKACSAGMTALIIGAQHIHMGYQQCIVGVATESMSNAPFILPRHLPTGGLMLEDTIDRDGYLDPVKGVSVAMLAEKTARELKISRADQDAWSLESYKKASKAWKVPKTLTLVISTASAISIVHFLPNTTQFYQFSNAQD
ncbi:unnamed protein product [Anisakis simplex]|uniref:Thiolase N-terminal domain-containing protein n=1 Tax=Anisakis simplex TaxID=6269 RepID=A0A3P6NDN5_ANISI|nr:unnamed protein product [Anisakis simplex]